MYSRARNRSSSWPFPTSFPPSRLSTSLLFIQYKRSLWRIVRFSRSVCRPIVAQCLNPLYLHPSYKMDGSFLYWDPVFLPECHMSPIFVSARARLNTPLFLLDYNNQEGVLYSVRRKTSQALNAIDYKRRRCRPFEWRGISLWVSDVCLLLYRIKCWIPPPPFLFFFFLTENKSSREIPEMPPIFVYFHGRVFGDSIWLDCCTLATFACTPTSVFECTNNLSSLYVYTL